MNCDNQKYAKTAIILIGAKMHCLKDLIITATNKDLIITATNKELVDEKYTLELIVHNRKEPEKIIYKEDFVIDKNIKNHLNIVVDKFMCDFKAKHIGPGCVVEEIIKE